MYINPGIKKIFWGLFAIAFIVVFVILWAKNPAPEHIEDTNGADNYALQQITEEEIVNLSIGSRGGLTTSETTLGPLSDGKKYSCKKFTGVQELYVSTILKGSDISVYLTDFKVNGGNFAFYVVLDGEIVGEVNPDEFGTADFTINNIEKTATLQYIIAGESADFKFTAPVEW